MRCTVFLFILFSTVGSFAATYQDEAGNHLPLKTKDGNDHPFDGHLAPNSSRQNIDLTNADFTQGAKRLKERFQPQLKAGFKSQLQAANNLRNLQVRAKRANAELRKLQQKEKQIVGSMKKIKSLSNDPVKQKAEMVQLGNRLQHTKLKIEKRERQLKRHQFQLLAITAAPDLRGIDLRGAKLENATLDDVLLAEANLAKTNLSGTSLLNVDLSDANMRNVELGAAQLKDANLSRANLRGAGVYAADFTGANLSGAVLRDIDGWEEAVWTDAYYQADDPPWWPEGMDATKLNIREVSSEQKPVIEEIIE